MNKEKSQRTTSMSFKDVLIDYGFHGLDRVKEAAQEGKVSLAVLQRAVTEVAKDPTIDGTDLAIWVSSITPSPEGKGPGRGMIEPGKMRDYKVQEVKGSTFLRIPALGLSKGMTVPVERDPSGKRLIVHLDWAKAPVIKD